MVIVWVLVNDLVVILVDEPIVNFDLKIGYEIVWLLCCIVLE